MDLGCGTGASGAAWALACPAPPRVVGVDRHPWAVEEARRTCQDLGVQGSFRVGDLTRVRLEAEGTTPRRRDRGAQLPGDGRGPGRPGGVLLAFAVNEIAARTDRDALLATVLRHADAGGPVLVIEPLARAAAPWWNEWRVRMELPPLVQKLDRAAGLDHRELTGRSLSL